MYPPEFLFVSNVDDLKDIVANPTPKNLFEAAAKLRLLLVDQNPLIHQANQKIRQKLFFIVNQSRSLPDGVPPPNFYAAVDGLSPASSPFPNPKIVRLDEFLNTTVMIAGGHVLTVKDTIKYLANYAGGVHKSKPDSESMALLEQAATTIQLGGMPSVLRSLRAICEITVVGCQPLYEALRS